MNVLVTGANGFLGRHLCLALEQTHKVLPVHRKTPPQVLDTYCRDADFVFHLAGVNRADTEAAFWEGNVGFTQQLLRTLQKWGNTCPVAYASSVRAGENTPYGNSKLAAEKLVLAHGSNTAIYRLPNTFGKWCRPQYNSVVATFCHQIARGMPIRVDDPEKMLELSYIDDVVKALLRALEGEWGYAAAPKGYEISVGQLAGLLQSFYHGLQTPILPRMKELEEKLYATFLSYLPREKVCTPLTVHEDQRGFFAELMRVSGGQVSVNVSRPGVTKGQHYHHSKWEIFVAVSGEGVIRQRRLDSDEIWEFPVSGQRLTAVRILPGFVHSLENVSETENLVTVIWANEWFDPENTDTYSREV